MDFVNNVEDEEFAMSFKNKSFFCNCKQRN